MITDKLKTSTLVYVKEGNTRELYDSSEYFSGKQILDHDYQDEIDNIIINSYCFLNEGERMKLADNINEVRKILLEYTKNTISSMLINVFDTGKLDIDKFKKKEWNTELLRLTGNRSGRAIFT